MSAPALLRRLVNSAWLTACAPRHARFIRTLDNVAEVQRRHLLHLLAANAGTEFGRRHGFARIRSATDFKAQVPVIRYDQLSGAIDAIARGEQGVLTRDRVTRFQPTSGSAGAVKWIPWTPGLGREFRNGIAPWMVALYRRKPGLSAGTAYWSISPPATAERVHGRLRVGFEQDAEYLGVGGARLFALVSAVPPALAHCADMKEFRTRTLTALLGDENLALISVWSPTFLSTLLGDFLGRPDEILNVLRATGAAGRHRAAVLCGHLRAGAVPEFLAAAWPRLQVISCWTHGPSEPYLGKLRRWFPQVEIEGKGLVATEAFVSLPFAPGADPVLAVTSHFFEFEDAESGAWRLAHELTEGGIYRVIVTTGGGLYRYALGDLVRVTGFLRQAPCLRFVGREGEVSDRFGEKLQGAFVQGVVRRAFAEQAIAARFFLVAPTDEEGAPAYGLFVESDSLPDAARLQASVERGLSENFHYAHCRKLGQLFPVRVFRIASNAMAPEAVFQQEMLARGQKLGDIKMVVLDRQPGWEKRFHGAFVA